MADAPILELKNISFSYGAATVLDDLNLHIHEGNKVGLVGANGVGKTTLLHTIMGLLPRQQGSVFFAGEKITGKKAIRDMRLKTGFLFQNADDQLFSPTVLEDVMFGPLNQGKSVDEAKELAIDTLHSLGLHDFENRVPYRLSGGEKKLVSLATILAMKPRLLLLDEPTTGLDIKTRSRLIEIINDLEQACMVVSHEPDFLEATTDFLLALKHGKIQEGKYMVHTHMHTHRHGDIPHTHKDQH
ncbi:MAG: energy-coupling factor ABC transporter ATP-binding protein [Desulfovibrio sp.]